MVSIERAEHLLQKWTRESDRLAGELKALEKNGPTDEVLDARESLDDLKIAISRLPGYLAAFRPFDGFALVIGDMDRPPMEDDGLDRFFALSGTDEADDDEGNLSRGGRPRKQEIAKAAYDKIFPNGHGTITLKEVVRKVEVEVKMPVSVDTLSKALRKTQR